jgi:AcrR family transcriptional regulator
VLRGALAVLRREGIGGTTMDAIAVESGVARSTLYRNWESREQLLAEAIDEIAGAPAPRRMGRPIAEELARVAIELARSLRASEWGLTLPAIVAAAQADETLSEHYRRFTDARRRPVLDAVHQAIVDGELPHRVDPDDLLDAIVGPIFYRALVRRVPTSPAWVRAHVATTIAQYRREASRS